MRDITAAFVLLLPIMGCSDQGGNLTPTTTPLTVPAKIIAPAATGTVTQEIPPTLEPNLIPDTDMYIAVINKFFADSYIVNMMQSDKLRQQIVYIEPAFTNMGRPNPPSVYTGKAIPSRIMQLIKMRVEVVGLAPVEQDQAGGGYIIVGSITSISDRNGKPQPAIDMIFGVGPGGCGRFMQIGYRLTKTSTGWEAEPYDRGMC
ncbi:MAG TPA: hypothetical protein VKY74_20345 [Chloroflexia bacterium]|nr:hypothetical protein [Chloroflexia bacterium]